MTRRLLAILLLACAALAGGGPETTLVVVNAASPVSRRVANEYARLRDIPPGHLLFLDGIPHLGVVSLDFFKESIWKPIDTYMAERGLEGQIDLITYSADFPYGVNFRSEAERHQQIGGIASLTGVTFLVEHVMDGDRFWTLELNRYFRFDAGEEERRKMRRPTGEEMGHSVRATQAMRTGNWAEAAREFEALLATYKESPRYWYNYACCLARLRRTAKALEVLEKSAETGFNNARHAAQDPDLESLRNDPRFRAILQRMASVTLAFHPAHGFRSAYAWDREERPVAEGGMRYHLSTQLAYTGFKGNSVPEVLAYLRAAAKSDGTKPDGTVYICRNSNIRSTSREPFFSSLVARMKDLGRKVEILEKGKDGQTGVIPVGKGDVFGAVVGIAGFSWAKSKSRILPGAICEHLTSHGANFGTPGQTKITEFLRHGAAGSSGTVMEPLSIHQKFPNPMIHAFYAEGCSLAEAFFQSVWGPYQLMVAGDGLARPFAKFVKVTAKAPPGPWKGAVEIAPSAQGAAEFELWIDGRRVARGGTLTFDSTQVDDGRHEVRVVAVSDDVIETRSYTKLDVTVENHGKKGAVVHSVDGPTVTFEAKGAPEMEVTCGSRVFATGAKCTVDTSALGPGPVVLEPRLLFGKERAWRGAPVEIEVEAPAPARVKLPGHPRKPGLRGIAVLKKEERAVAIAHLGGRRTGMPLVQRGDLAAASLVRLHGEFEAKEEGFFQLLVRGAGHVTVRVDGRELCNQAALGNMLFLPVSLKKGWHPLELELKPRGKPNLEIHLAGDQVHAPPTLRHWSHTALKQQPKIEKKDGKIVVPQEGLLLIFKRSARDVAAVTLFPGKEDIPYSWEVEYTSGSGKLRPVKEPSQVAALQGEKKPPAFVEVSFKPVRVKKLRIRPVGGGTATLARIEVLGKRKK